MFGKKKNTVLTASTCMMLEQLRLAIEVYTGQRTCFVRVDFNTYIGRVRIGDTEKNFTVFYRRDDLLDFTLEGDCRVTSRFSDNNSSYVKVMRSKDAPVVSTIAGEFEMVWAGTSSSNRAEVPFYLPEAEHCAQVRGMTLQQLLQSKP